MNECIILYRIPSSQRVGVIHRADDDSGDPHLFANWDEAIAFTRESGFLNAVIYQIVELDEL